MDHKTNNSLKSEFQNFLGIPRFSGKSKNFLGIPRFVSEFLKILGIPRIFTTLNERAVSNNLTWQYVYSLYSDNNFMVVGK